MKYCFAVSVFRETVIGMAAAAAVLLLTGCAVVGLFGADSVAMLSSWKELGCGAGVYIVALSSVMLVCRLRGRRAALCAAISLALIFAVCAVFVCGKGLLPKHLGDPSAAPANGLDIVAAARSQIGVTVKYDPAAQGGAASRRAGMAELEAPSPLGRHVSRGMLDASDILARLGRGRS